jgi:WD40 repeat protein
VIELTGHKGLVVALAYSPDGRTLASASADGTARLWDLTTGKLRATLQSPAARAYCVAFSPDGALLSVGYAGQAGLVQLVELPALRQRVRWAANPSVTRGIAFRSDGSLLATAGDAGVVQLWQVEDGHRHSRMEPDGTTGAAVTFSPDGRLIAAVTSRTPTVRLRSAKNGQLYRSLRGVSDWGHALAFNPTGDRIAVGLERTVALWNPADYRPPTLWPAHAGAVLGVAFTPDGQTLLTGGADGLVKLWDPAGRLRYTFDWRIGDVGAVAFAPDGLTAAAGGNETILVWDVTE